MTWKVGRVWWPKHPRLRPRKGARDRIDDGVDAASWMPFDFADGLGSLAIGLVLVVVVFLLFTVVFPIVVIGIEILLVLILFLFGLAGRFLFGVPWTVRAKGDGGRELTWRVKGFGNAGDLRDEVADALARGERDPRPAGALT